jgi:hypothetical protein
LFGKYKSLRCANLLLISTLSIHLETIEAIFKLIIFESMIPLIFKFLGSGILLLTGLKNQDPYKNSINLCKFDIAP